MTKRVTPMLHKSASLPYSLSATTCGAAYDIVPANRLIGPSCVRMIRAHPKSANFTTASSVLSDRSKLSGYTHTHVTMPFSLQDPGMTHPLTEPMTDSLTFRSKCKMLRLCKCARPCRMSAAIRDASCSENGFLVLMMRSQTSPPPALQWQTRQQTDSSIRHLQCHGKTSMDRSELEATRNNSITR